MANTINVTYKVNEDGSLEKISQKANKAANATDKLSGATDNYSKKQKGVAGATSNSTKAFSKMLQGVSGGLVPAYATLAANVFALSAAFNFLKRAADVKILEQGQVSYAKNTGLALQTVTRGLREASGGMLGFREAAEAAAIGVAKGFSPSQLNELADGARKASAALGRNFEDSFDRLIRGASKAEPELLDELGITLRLETATKKYAESIKKNVKELTAFERSQAVLIETQRQLNDLYGDVDAVSNPFVKLGKTFEDLVKSGTNLVMPLFEGIANIINRSAIAAVAVFGMLGVSILKAMVPMDGIKNAFATLQTNSAASLTKAKADLDAYKLKIEQTRQALQRANAESAKTAARNLRQSGIGTSSALVQKAASGTLTDPKQIGQLKASLKKAEEQYRRHGEVKTGIFKGADIKVLQNFRTSLNNMDKSSVGFFAKQKMRYQKLTLSAKVAYTKIRAVGTRTFAAIGRAAQAAGKVMNTAMKAAGIIGIFMMIWEIGQEIMNAPFDIVMAILKGFDFIVKGAMKMLGSIIDGVGNMYKSIINVIISGWNYLAGTAMGKSLGLGPIEELNSNSTAARDAMENLADSMGSAADAFKNSGWGKGLKGFQDRRQAALAENEAYNTLKDTIRSTGEELNNILDGLAGKKGAAKEIAAATALGSLDISGLLRKAQATKDPEKRANALNLMRTQLERIGELSPGVQAAFNSMEPEKVAAIEASAQAATGGLAALKDGISNINASLSSGDLLSAELALGALKTTAETTSSAFGTLFGPDSAAAKKALADFEASFSGANMTASQFLSTLTALRISVQELALAEQRLNYTSGIMTQILGNKIALQKAMNDLKEKELLLAKATEGGPEAIKLQQEIALLKEKVRLAGIAVAQDAGGQMMGDAARTSAMVGSTAATLSGDASVSDKINAVQGFMSPMLDTLKNLGPDGELITSVVQGALSVADAWSGALATINDADATGPQKLAAGLEAVGATVSQLGQMMNAQSKATIAGIDREIDAEKKRDGKSKESMAKIAQLEKKKESAKRKQFEMDKKIKLASAIIATALGITNALAEGGPIMGPILATMIGAMGAAQIAIISGQTYQGGGGAPDVSGPSKIAVGNRQNSVDLAKARSPSGELSYARGSAGTGSGMTNYTPAFTGMKYRASGGNTGFMVGEQGPEIFTPDRPGRITPADEVGEMSAPVNVNFTIQAIDTQGMEQALMNQRGSLIGMIREAANAHGENFLESINTEALTREKF